MEREGGGEVLLGGVMRSYSRKFWYEVLVCSGIK